MNQPYNYLCNTTAVISCNYIESEFCRKTCAYYKVSKEAEKLEGIEKKVETK